MPCMSTVKTEYLHVLCLKKLIFEAVLNFAPKLRVTNVTPPLFQQHISNKTMSPFIVEVSYQNVCNLSSFGAVVKVT